MQSNPNELVPEKRIVEISQMLVPHLPVYVQESYNSVIKGRMAKQRRYEVKALIDRVKATECRVAALEKTLKEIQPHFFEDHPISKKIDSALSSNK